MRVLFREPDEVQFILLPLAQPPRGSLLFAARHVVQAGDSDTNAKDIMRNGSIKERLVSFVGGELNPEIASRMCPS